MSVAGLALEGVSHAYGRGGGGHRLVDVTFAVDQGSLCCLLGPNGAGKTTLLRCVLGLLGFAGTIRVLGEDVTRLPGRRRAQAIAYVPQSSAAPFPFTALEMAVMGRTPHVGRAVAPSAADRGVAFGWLETLGIGALAHRAYASLSGGERQLTLLARALAQEAPVLVLDEPTAALDYGNEGRFLALVASLVRDGRTVLMSTHQPLHAFLHADRAVLLRDGRVLADGAPGEVATSERLTALYGTPVHVASVPRPDVPGAVQRVCLPLPAMHVRGPGRE